MSRIFGVVLGHADEETLKENDHGGH